MGRPPINHEEKRAEVAEACFKVIAMRGLESLTLQDIATELGCTTGVLGYYFRNKNELLKYTKNYLFDRINSNMAAAAKNAKGVSKLQAMLTEALPIDQVRVVMWQIYLAFLSQTVGDAPLMERQAQRNMHSIEIIAEEIRGLQKQQLLSLTGSVKEEAMAAVAFIEGLGFHAAIDPKSFTSERQKRLVTLYIERAFASNPRRK